MKHLALQLSCCRTGSNPRRWLGSLLPAPTLGHFQLRATTVCQCLGSPGQVGSPLQSGGLSSHWPAPEQQKDFSMTAAADWGSSRTCRPGLAGARCCLSSSAVVEGRGAGKPCVSSTFNYVQTGPLTGLQPGLGPPSPARMLGLRNPSRRHSRPGARHLRGKCNTTTKPVVIPITNNAR